MSPSTRMNNARPPARSIVSGVADLATKVARAAGNAVLGFGFALVTRVDFLGVFLAADFCTGVRARGTGAVGAGGWGC